MPRLTQLIPEAFRLVRYSLVGGAAVIVHAAIAFSLILWTTTPPTVAHFLGFAVGFFVALYGHHTFTFRVKGSARQYMLRFFILSALVLLIGEAVLIGLLIGVGTGPIVAQSAAIIVSCAVSYVGSRLWAFKAAPIPPRTDPPEADLAA